MKNFSIFLVVFLILSALFVQKAKSKVNIFKSKIELLKEYVTIADMQEPLEKRISLLNDIKLSHEKGIMLVTNDAIIAEDLLQRVDVCLKKVRGINVLSKETLPPAEVMQKYLRMFFKMSMRSSLEDFTKFIYSVIYEDSYLKIKEIHVEAEPGGLLKFDVVIYLIYKRS